MLIGEHPAIPGTRKPFSWHCTSFRYSAPGPLRAFLRRQAEANLARHGIAEPATWEPPARWVATMTGCLARNWGLPIRRHSDFSDIGHLNLPAPPSPAMRAVTMRAGVLSRIKIAAGFTIIDRATTPLASTGPGCEFLREASRVLQAAGEQAWQP